MNLKSGAFKVTLLQFSLGECRRTLPPEWQAKSIWYQK
jgi:hypothetical protein